MAAKKYFRNVSQSEVPNGRNGKHKGIVTAILARVDNLKPGSALKIALAELKESKENVRSALNRESSKQGRPVATAADNGYLYVWNKNEVRGTKPAAVREG